MLPQDQTPQNPQPNQQPQPYQPSPLSQPNTSFTPSAPNNVSGQSFPQNQPAPSSYGPPRPTQQPAPVPNPGSFAQQYIPQQPNLPAPQTGAADVTGQQPQNYNAPSYPQQPISNSYQSYQDQQPSYGQPKKSGKRMLLAGALFAGLLLIAGGAIFAYASMRTTPDSVFEDAVENSLSTRQVAQTLEADEGNIELLYDVSNAKDPRVHARTQASFMNLTFDFEQYATLKDGYVKYSDYAGILEPGKPIVNFKDKWMQERKDGASASGGSLFPSAHLHLFGDWIFGNFSAKDKNDLKDFIVKEKVHTYDPTKVEKK
ncbi:MAG: hypothetical protein JWP13_103, partial [Candidatus Saccharibacteria bacterium]|nr:hypothetical protein [Candidatus Saccharibacteria bacterium]